MLRYLATCCAILFTSYCSAQDTTHPSDTLTAFMEEVFQTIRKHSVYKQGVDWEALKVRVFQGVDTASTYDDLVPVVRNIYQTIGDNHGALYMNKQRVGARDLSAMQIRKELKVQQPQLKALVIDDAYGYLLLQGDRPGDVKKQLANSIADSLCRLSQRNIRGLIIDLRLHEGGSIYPLFTGISQVIGNGTIGSWTGIDRKPGTMLSLKNGKLMSGKQIVASVKNNCRIRPDLKVAVLLSGVTASAGEHLAIALKGRPNTVFIGEQTAGFITGVATYRLKAHVLAISTSFMADRNHNVYTDYIEPDIKVTGGDNFDDLTADKKIQAALQWLR